MLKIFQVKTKKSLVKLRYLGVRQIALNYTGAASKLAGIKQFVVIKGQSCIAINFVGSRH